VLIIDDERSMRTTIRLMFEPNIKVDEAEYGRAGLPAALS
jgi:DNA-binding response OmpR family regulator